MRQSVTRLSMGQSARTQSVPSPLGGLNTRDPIQSMPPTDAIILDNFFCTPYDVMVRYGFTQQTPTISVNTLMTYSGMNGVNQMFAASGSNIYDVSVLGTVGAAVVTGMTSDKWQTTSFGAGGGTYLICANGADPVQEYNGTTWSVPAITGVTSSTLNNPLPFKGRLFFVQRNTLSLWYLAPLSIAGAANQLDLSTIFTQGGQIETILDWSLDGGYGMDDYLAVITTSGEVAVYKGTDPSSISTWSLVGVYQLGSPVGKRCASRYAGDVLILTQDGLDPLSKSLMSSRVNTQVAITDKVQHTISDYISQFGTNFGWQIQLFPKENMLIVNVPTSTGETYQMVMNTISGAWSRWTGMNATCFILFNDFLYFGTTSGVYKAWDGLLDNGGNINFEAQQSFNYFGSLDQLKKLEMIRPNITTSGNPSILLGANADYDSSKPIGIASFSPNASVPLWDSALWDVAMWGGTMNIKRDWQTAYALGYCFAAHMTGSSNGIITRWSSTDYLIKAAGVV